MIKDKKKFTTFLILSLLLIVVIWWVINIISDSDMFVLLGYGIVISMFVGFILDFIEKFKKMVKKK